MVPGRQLDMFVFKRLAWSKHHRQIFNNGV